MKYAFFQGCNIPIRIEQYANATQAVFSKFDVELQVIPDFNCCGYPVRNVDEKAYILPSVRNMAIAEKAGLDILVICNCCFASLQKAKNVLSNDLQLKDELNAILAKENLQYIGNTKIKHYLTVLHDDIGTEKIKSKLVNKFQDLKISVIHGCHILRPREITHFDDSFVPTITENLMQTAGVTSLDWQGKLECCGAPLLGINDELSMDLTERKLANGKESGADYLCVGCPWCQVQFDSVQEMMTSLRNTNHRLPSILYPQLLGLAMGIDGDTLGIKMNKIDISGIEAFFSQEKK